MERIQLETGYAVTLELVGLLDAERGWTGAEHSHPFWELLYLKSGEMAVRVEGSGGRMLTAGGMILIPPGKRHRFENAGDAPSRALYVGCRAALDWTHAASDSGHAASDAAEEIPEDLEGFEGLENLKQTLDALADRETPQKKAAFSAAQGTLLCAFCGIFAQLDEKRSPDRSHEPSRSGELLAAKAKDYVKANVSRSVTVKEIADSLYITPHYLGVTFRRVTGMTIHEYHLRVRMQKALDLVRTTAIPLADLSEQLGFDTPQYFSSSFSRYYGAPPSAFRK